MFPWKKSAAHALLLMVSLALSSCNDSKEPTALVKDDKDPVGVWTIDGEATLAANQAQIDAQIEKIPEEQKTEAKTQLEEMFKELSGTMEFRMDNTLVSTTIFNGKEMTIQGTWEIDGDQITSKVKNQNGEETSVGTIKNGLLSLSPDQNQFVVLKRE